MELPGIGNNCAHPRCNKLDFLPYTCAKCSKIFCESHYKQSNHSCTVTTFEDARSHKCPLCHQQLAVRRGEDPNVTVERHIAQGCATGKAKTGGISSSCTFKGCKKKELVPMTCKDCRKQFCIRHRFPDDHNCQGQRAVLAAQASKRQQASSKPARHVASSSSSSRSASRSRPPQRLNGVGADLNAARQARQAGYDEQAALDAAIAASMQAQPAEMTEEEALAAAIQASMQDQSGSSTSNSAAKSDGCTLQ
eukprot:TRINITY_DN8192_c0_g1_i3.p1 TRINITY_DN8192_c0_g1~~TRINITY_DN8192_c0_g1_i3.p1  ORF type:complete len:251 (+),score=41.44 TRINITY_DN8192_c0_g1_i3:19-771(+)